MKNAFLLIFIFILLTSCAAKLTSEKKTQIEQQLKDMVKVDQIAANIPNGKYNNFSKEQWLDFQDSVFTVHKENIEKIFNSYGFLGYNKVSKEGSHNFWLLVQHCDKYPAFQERVLIKMDKEVKKKNANSSNYAYLYDRVKVNAEEKQMFGTQVTYQAGRAIPKIGLIDSVNVDIRRKEYELEPLKDYLNMMTTSHYEMNKEVYLKMGIMKPNLH